MSEQRPEQSCGSPPAYRRPTPIRRLGCGLALVLWFSLLLLPCFLCVLATQNQIMVPMGGAPDQVLRIWLINEPDRRGLGISRPSVVGRDDGLCVQTDVNFLLWMGKGEAAAYCDCYNRSQEQDAWSLVSTNSGACPP